MSEVKKTGSSRMDRVQPVAPSNLSVENLPPIQPRLESAVLVELSEDLSALKQRIGQKKAEHPDATVKIFFITDDEDIGYDARGKKKKKGKKTLIWTLEDFQARAEEHGLTDWNAGFPAEKFEQHEESDE